MAETLNKIAYNIIGRLEVNSNQSSNIDLREIKDAVQTKRALFLRNELNKNRTIDPAIIQDLGCVELEVADKADCCDISVDCDILRTKLDIPSVIEMHNDFPLWVNPIDKLEYPFSFVKSLERARWTGNGRFNTNMIFGFLLNNRIYIISKDTEHQYMTHINVRGVFENPQEAGRFVNCTTNSSCYSDDDAYPLKRWMVDYIETAVYNDFISKIKNPIDNSNDSKSNPLPQGIK